MQFYEKALANYGTYTSDPSKKDYFSLAATLVLLIVLLFMVYPAAIHVSTLNKEVSDGNILLKTLNTKISDLQTAETNYNQIKDNLDLLNTALPLGSDVKTYVKNPLEAIALKNNLTFKSLQFSDVPVSNPAPGITLSLREFTYTSSLLGDLNSIEGFIKDMETYTRLTKLKRVEISQNDSATLLLTIEGTVNFLDQPINIIPNAKGATNAQ